MKKIFSLSDFEKLLRNGDDTKNNVVVVDCNGKMRLIQDIEFAHSQYPVSFEAFIAGNCYVGENMNIDLDDLYDTLLEGFLTFQETGYIQHIDTFTTRKRNAIIKDLQKYGYTI